jgi:DNA polymerase (family 10)
MTLDKDGLHSDRKAIARSEEGIYQALGLVFIEPELREGRGEIELAKNDKLPQLVTDADIRGHFARSYGPIGRR